MPTRSFHIFCLGFKLFQAGSLFLCLGQTQKSNLIFKCSFIQRMPKKITAHQPSVCGNEWDKQTKSPACLELISCGGCWRTFLTLCEPTECVQLCTSGWGPPPAAPPLLHSCCPQHQGWPLLFFLKIIQRILQAAASVRACGKRHDECLQRLEQAFMLLIIDSQHHGRSFLPS